MGTNLLVKSQEFKVVAVSSNTNSFGLTQMILFNKHGVAYSVLANSLRVKKKDDVLNIPVHYIPDAYGDPKIQYDWGCFECPERMPDPPMELVEEMWGSAFGDFS